MLEQLLNLVKENATDSVINNPNVPNEKNQEVVADATHSIFTGLQNVIAGGGLQNVLGLFGNNSSSSNSSIMSNPIVQMIAGGLVKKLIGNHNLTPQAANGVASSLIPNVLNNLISKTNNSNDNSFDLAGIISSLAGGRNASVANSGGGIGQLIQQFTGGDNGGNFSNIASSLLDQFTGGAQSNIQQQQASGGITGLLKQLIGG